MPRGPRLAEAAGGVRLPRGVSGVGGALLTELLRDKKKKKAAYTRACSAQPEGESVGS